MHGGRVEWSGGSRLIELSRDKRRSDAAIDPVAEVMLLPGVSPTALSIGDNCYIRLARCSSRYRLSLIRHLHSTQRYIYMCVCVCVCKSCVYLCICIYIYICTDADEPIAWRHWQQYLASGPLGRVRVDVARTLTASHASTSLHAFAAVPSANNRHARVQNL